MYCFIFTQLLNRTITITKFRYVDRDFGEGLQPILHKNQIIYSFSLSQSVSRCYQLS